MTLPIFTLQPDHAAWRLGGAALTADDAGGLTFEFHAAGRATVVLKDRIGGDWVLPAGEKAISKEGNAVKLVSLDEPIVKGKKEAEATLAECRKQTPPEADAAPLDKMAVDIQALPLSVTDPAEFGKAMLQLSNLKQSLEDYLFAQRRDEILRVNAPRPLPTPVPKTTPAPKPAASPSASPAAPSPVPAAK